MAEKKTKKKEQNPLDEYVEELEHYEEGCEPTKLQEHECDCQEDNC